MLFLQAFVLSYVILRRWLTRKCKNRLLEVLP
jgi:hypothetical protein